MWSYFTAVTTTYTTRKQKLSELCGCIDVVDAKVSLLMVPLLNFKRQNFNDLILVGSFMLYLLLLIA